MFYFEVPTFLCGNTPATMLIGRGVPGKSFVSRQCTNFSVSPPQWKNPQVPICDGCKNHQIQHGQGLHGRNFMPVKVEMTQAGPLVARAYLHAVGQAWL